MADRKARRWLKIGRKSAGLVAQFWMELNMKDTLKTQVRTRAPQRVEIVVAFSVEAGVLKARHDIALNAIRNLR